MDQVPMQDQFSPLAEVVSIFNYKVVKKKYTPTHGQWAQQYIFLFPTFRLQASVANYHLQAVYHIMCSSVHFTV